MRVTVVDVAARRQPGENSILVPVLGAVAEFFWEDHLSSAAPAYRLFIGVSDLKVEYTQLNRLTTHDTRSPRGE